MSKDWYIWINGEKISVTEEIYYTYKRAEWRDDKQENVRKHMECSLEYLYEQGFEIETVVNQKTVEEIVEDKLMLDMLYKALDEFTNEERYLIEELFFKEKSEHMISKETGFSQNTINYHKNKLLDKLRKFFNL